MTKEWKAPRPPPTRIFPQSQRIKILSHFIPIVEKPNNYVFGNDSLPHSPRGRGCKLQTFDLCLHIVMVIGKCTDVLKGIFLVWWGGEVGGYVGGSSHGVICHGRREFQALSKKTIKKQI